LKIKLRLNWHKSGAPGHRAFKEKFAYDYCMSYVKKINGYIPMDLDGQLSKTEIDKKLGSVWFCDRSSKAKLLSSEDVAEHLKKVWDHGVSELQIVIGGADGFSASDEKLWKPELRWSFGNMTLPHELAAVVASEQIYRALTIIKKHPYHSGH
jgi:hypothetical protein